jgi:uncharacterized protein (DUF362 family)
METVYAEFERNLRRSAERHAGDPRREMIRLFLLALEREEIVTVGYREDAIVQRLEDMPIDEQVREVIRHALVWTWKDEEMHTIYIRGALLRSGSFLLRVQSFLQQMVGAVGGWSSSVQQHVRWRQAPLSRFFALLVTWVGLLIGKVPRAVWRELRYQSFRDFCVFNIDTEKTAALCWQRLVELTGAHGMLPAASIDDFRRMQADEERHARVFSILAAALDDQDRLVPGETADSLEEKLRSVSAFFVRRERRASKNPLGSGGLVWVAEGQSANEKLPLFRRLLDDLRLPGLLQERASALGKTVAELSLAIKPTFMLGYHRKDLSTITDPELLRELGRYLREQGCRDVAVVEAPILYDHFYANRTVVEVADYFEIPAPEFRVLDVSEEQVPHDYFRGMAQYTVSRSWSDAEFRISFGKVRSHPVDQAYLSIANMQGLGSRCDEFLFCDRQAHRDAAVMTLISDFPPHLALLDGYDSAPDGLLGFMGCPRPKSPRRLYAGADSLAVDMVVARHMGLEDPKQSAILKTACHWFGDPSGNMEVRGVDLPIAGWQGPHHTEVTALLSVLAYPVYVMASGRGALFVPEMDEEAFPPLRAPSWRLRLGRRMLQSLLGLRHGH